MSDSPDVDCSSCGSKNLGGPLRNSAIFWTGLLDKVETKAWVCLDCGHLEFYATKVGLKQAREFVSGRT